MKRIAWIGERPAEGYTKGLVEIYGELEVVHSSTIDFCLMKESDVVVVKSHDLRLLHSLMHPMVKQYCCDRPIIRPIIKPMIIGLGVPEIGNRIDPSDTLYNVEWELIKKIEIVVESEIIGKSTILGSSSVLGLFSC